MKILKIVQKRTNKRKQNDNPNQEVGAVLLFVFLLPYVVSCLWGHIGEETEVLSANRQKESLYLDEKYEILLSGEWGNRTLTMEEYLIQKLCQMMPPEENASGASPLVYEEEALKAQAVLLRTEVYKSLKENRESMQTETMTGQAELMDSEHKMRYQRAVQETDGIILAYQGEPIQAAYFALSSGKTRDAAELWGNDSYPYLRSIECTQDIQAVNYQSQMRLEKEKFCQLAYEAFQAEDMEQIIWGQLETVMDEAGYVTKVRMKDLECGGERFRYLFGLNSACFTLEWTETELIFHVKGVGHGFGMSQYDANKRAAAGERFDEILKNYFFQAELVKIE